MTKIAKAGAICFFLWGALHLAGGAAILFAILSSGASAGYAFYDPAGGGFPPLAGAVLAYLAYDLTAAGIAAMVLAVMSNWKNSEAGLAANTALGGITEVGLALFLMIPGHVGLAEAAPGIVLYACGVALGGFACRRGHARSRPA